MVDAFFGGAFMLKSEDEAWALFENFSSNSIHHAFTRRNAPAPKESKADGLFKVRHFANVAT